MYKSKLPFYWILGDIEFAVNKVNAEEGEFAGVFVSKQPGKYI